VKRVKYNRSRMVLDVHKKDKKQRPYPTLILLRREFQMRRRLGELAAGEKKGWVKVHGDPKTNIKTTTF